MLMSHYPQHHLHTSLHALLFFNSIHILFLCFTKTNKTDSPSCQVWGQCHHDQGSVWGTLGLSTDPLQVSVLISYEYQIYYVFRLGKRDEGTFNQNFWAGIRSYCSGIRHFYCVECHEFKNLSW